MESGTTKLIIWNDEMEDMIKIIKSPADSGLWLKRVNKTIQNEAKEQKGGFFSMLLGTLVANLWGSILAGKKMIRAVERFFRARYGSAIKNWDY